jgi:hypothetical protein
MTNVLSSDLYAKS